MSFLFCCCCLVLFYFILFFFFGGGGGEGVSVASGSWLERHQSNRENAKFC